MSSSTPTPIVREKWNAIADPGAIRTFIKAVIKNDIDNVRKMLTTDLIDSFVKTRKGELVNPLYICAKK